MPNRIKENWTKAMEAFEYLNSFKYENGDINENKLLLGWECYKFLEKIRLYHNYKIREQYILNLISFPRTTFYTNVKFGRKITGGDVPDLPPIEIKTSFISKNKITLNTVIGTIDKTHAYFNNNSTKYRIYGPNTKYEFIFCLLNRISYDPVFCVSIPNYEKNGIIGGLEARTSIQNKLHNRYIEQKNKIENGISPGRDSYEIKWRDIEKDQTIKIFINKLNSVQRT